MLGAAGGIGQPLSLLLKQSPLITHLSLYDIVNTPGMFISALGFCPLPLHLEENCGQISKGGETCLSNVVENSHPRKQNEKQTMYAFNSILYVYFQMCTSKTASIPFNTICVAFPTGDPSQMCSFEFTYY